jgi:hypothetical protein
VIAIAFLTTFLFKKDTDLKHYETSYGKMVCADMTPGKVYTIVCVARDCVKAVMRCMIVT